MLCCATFPPQSSVAGTALCPTSAVGVSAISPGVSQSPRTASPTPGADVGAHSLDPGLAQPPRAGTHKAHSFGTPTLIGCPSGPLCSAVLSTPPLYVGNLLASAPEVGPASLPRRGTRSRSPRRRGLTCGWKGCNGPLNTGASLLWRPGLHPIAQLYRTPAPSGCLQAASTSPLRRPVLSTLFPSPCLYPQMHIRLGSQGGGTDHLSVLPASTYHALLWATEAPSLSKLSPHRWAVFLGCGNFSFQLPPTSSLLPPFFLPSYVEIFLILSGVWGLPLVFSRCSVRIHL